MQKPADKPKIIEVEEVTVEKLPISVTLTSVKLQSLRDAHVHYDGQVTKRHYEWIRAGSVVDVDILDAPILLEKRIKSQSCCNSTDTAIFQRLY